MMYWMMLRQLLQDQRGIAAVEYAVLIGVVGAAVFVAFNNFDLATAIDNLLAAGLGAVTTAETAAGTAAAR